MVAEFVQKRFPNKKYILDARLGITPEPSTDAVLDAAELRMLRMYNRYCDAIVFDEKRVILIEAKLVPRLGPLDGLHLYEQLLMTDPAMKEHKGKTVEKWFVYAVEDSSLNRVARMQGIKPVQYVPAWMNRYVELLHPRHRRAPKAGF